MVVFTFTSNVILPSSILWTRVKKLSPIYYKSEFGTLLFHIYAFSGIKRSMDLHEKSAKRKMGKSQKRSVITF